MSASAPADGRWLIVSDLHLEPGSQPPGPHADRFVEFVESVESLGSPGGVTLVLLGDVFELLNAPAPALKALGAVLDRHLRLVSALGRLQRGGVAVRIVPGNHDLDLTQPEVADLLAERMDVRPELHPWIMHVPGVLLAEHGNQHHEVNRVPLALAPDGFAPPAALLGGWRRDGRSLSALPRVVLRGVSALRAGAQRVTAQPAAQAELASAVERTGLDAATLARLHDASSGWWPAMAARALRRAVAGAPRHGYMLAGAARSAAALREAGVLPPVLVYGHVHDAADLALGAGVRYLNSGTWSPYALGAQLHRWGEAGLPFVDVQSAGGTVTAAVRWWNEPDTVL